MAGIVALKQSAWDSATAPQKAVARMLFNELELGAPASGALAGTAWYVWSDRRINQQFVENLSWVMSHLPDFNDSPVRNYPTTEMVEVERPIYEQVEVPVMVTEYDEDGEIISEEPLLDEEGNPVTRLVWQDSGETEMVEEEQSLGDPLTLAANANLTASWFTARQSLPSGWVPDDGEG